MAIKIAINAEIIPGKSQAGGVESFLKALIWSLGVLNDGDEQYFIIVDSEYNGWLDDVLSDNQHIVKKPKVSKFQKAFNIINNNGIGGLYSLIRNKLCVADSDWCLPNVSDGFYESLGCDVIHFPYQKYVLTAMPSVFNPHDLQHKHYPQFFNPKTIAYRESIYPKACQLCNKIVVASQWIKDDIVNQYFVSGKKIQVIPWAAPTESCQLDNNTSEIFKKYNLPEKYLFYPAATWPHKNHIRLLESLGCLRDKENIKINFVFTGSKYEGHWPSVEKTIKEYGLEDQVLFLGFVPFEDLCLIYKEAYFVFVPTLFEAASGPVFEAWQKKTPIACSHVTSLPEQVKDAGILFDPFSIESITKALERIWTEEGIREYYADKGEVRLNDFSWKKTAKAYRAVYRSLANLMLSDEEIELLNNDWMAGN